jgi:hypothetical protein
MTQSDLHPAHPLPSARAPFISNESGPERVTVPYAGQTRMQLTLASGMADARIRVDPDATELFVMTGAEGVLARVRLRVSAGELRVSWPVTFGSWLRAALAGEHRDIEIVLHPAVEWALQLRGGLSRLEADLSAGKLARLAISGGISNASFDLPATTSTVPVRVSGGVSHLTLNRPADAAVSLEIHGGVATLRLDDQYFDAVGGGLRITSGLLRGDVPRYVIEISGGASGLFVEGR